MATGNEALCALIKTSYQKMEPLSLHELALDLYKIYLIVGGMPRAVIDYTETKDFNFVLAAQKNINDAYIADMAKYVTANETNKIMGAFNSIPAQLAKENKKFQYKVIKSGARNYEYKTPIEWLKSSGVIIKCTKVNEGKLPLTAYADYSSFKIYLTDTGLLCSKFGVPPNAILSNTPSFNDLKVR